MFLEASFVGEAAGPVGDRLTSSVVLEQPELSDTVGQGEVSAAGVVEERAVVVERSVTAWALGPLPGRRRGWAAGLWVALGASPALGVGALHPDW